MKKEDPRVILLLGFILFVYSFAGVFVIWSLKPTNAFDRQVKNAFYTCWILTLAFLALMVITA